MLGKVKKHAFAQPPKQQDNTEKMSGKVKKHALAQPPATVEEFISRVSKIKMKMGSLRSLLDSKEPVNAKHFSGIEQRRTVHAE